jgi:N-acetylneuraminate synthase
MNIKGIEVGRGKAPFIIAELSNNHLQDIARAKLLIDSAVESGADAIKIQTYDADSLTIDCDKNDFVIKDLLWQGKTYYDLYKEISAPKSWTNQLFEYCNDKGVLLFSSPFDLEAVAILTEVDCPVYKIASFEAQDPSLIRAVAETGKPVIVSTGVSNRSEILETISWLEEYGCKDYVLLHCISSYPASLNDMNLNVIDELSKLTNNVGLSDHSLSDTAVLGAIAKGACVIEKHFTLDRADGGPDAAFSLEPDEFKTMANSAREMWLSLGNSEVLDSKKRIGSQHSRSVYAIKDIKKGEALSEKNIRVIRPGFGLKPKYFDELIDKFSAEDLTRGTAITWDLVK